MFKFNFQPDAAVEAESALPEDEVHLLASEEVAFNSKNCTIPNDLERLQLAEGIGVLKGRVSTSQAAGALDKSLTDSDLVPGKYEGGFKIWEGGIDLALYLTSGVLVPGGLSAPSRVLELGCGHGLPGIVALLKGAAVDFQDYNREVLQLLTIPTVLANWRNAHPDATAAEPPVRFFCGDWGTFGGLLERMQLSNAYDVVLTTETIYSLQGMRRLFSCIKQSLKRPQGVCFVSAKSFYFGVGGGVAEFLKMVNEDAEMCGKSEVTIEDGLSNRREILVLKWRDGVETS